MGYDEYSQLKLGRMHPRGETSRTRPPGGQPVRFTRRSVPCPKCGAKSGQACQRWVGGKISGVDVGGGHWRPMNSYHDERRIFTGKGSTSDPV